MPIQYDLPTYQNAHSVEDVNKYNKLDFYLAAVEAKMFPEWHIFNTLYGNLSWKPNMGTTLKSVRGEPTPVGSQTMTPKEITETPNKNTIETYEVTETATLKWHDFDSKLFYFLPSFQDFRENQVDFVHKDMVRQIAITNDFFIRTFMLHKTPNIAVPNHTDGNGMVIAAPTVLSNAMDSATIDAQGKNAAYWTAQIAKIGSPGLTLSALDYFCNVFRDDIGAPFFDGTVNTPKENELIKGKYVLVGSSEVYQQFKWDPSFQQFRNVNLSIVNDGFRGSIFDEITFKTERYPIRLKADGTMPAPQAMEAGSKRTRPNPEYVNAPFEIAWLCGGDAFKTIKVGPPPKAFASKKMSSEKFYSMRWNGEVYLTDQVLVKYETAGDPVYDLNSRGRFLKLQATTVMGAIPVNAYNVLPILFKRKRTEVQ